MFSTRFAVPAGLLAVAALTLPVHAGEGRAARTVLLPKYRQECAACHVAYPPGLLPADSWQRIMRGLPDHFGTDASLDPAAVPEISAWLAQHAATGRRSRSAPPEDRITRSTWFQGEHDEISPATWRRVKNPSNCAACHIHANQGVFDEHDVRIPR